ncbi:hypothetical protein V1514DRAFT_356489 [Lipomyces japonicus]|uniref:uncharacterized protein n=1 Tax=Lipomyces japonicus TaxID=56871 RepID=UPI0034CD63A7
MRNKFRPKHQRLILQCYPGGRAQEKHPNASELSYLLYYVSTRRTKLQKVGRFLERKVKHDLWRGRPGNVQVTLDITKALIEKCPGDLNLYADNVVAILSAVLNSNDLSLWQYSEATFRAFCDHHDGGLLADDQEFVSQFTTLLKLYMGVADKAHAVNNESAALLVSLKSAKSIASSGALSSSSGQLQTQINIILPTIMRQLYSESKDEHLIAIDAQLIRQEANTTNQAGSGTIAPRASTSTTILPDAGDNNNNNNNNNNDDDDENAAAAAAAADEASLVALSALKKLFDASNESSSQIRYSSKAVVKFIMINSKNQSWATSLIDLMAKWTPVQMRFIILRSILEILADLSVENLTDQLVITELVSSLLSSSVNLAGLSVLDVVHLLFSRILLLLSNPEVPGNGGDDGKELVDPLRQKLLDRLTMTIGDMATHIYYTNQIVDMVTEILVHMRPSDYEEEPVTAGTGSNGKLVAHVLHGGSGAHGTVSGPPSSVNSYANLDRYIKKAASQKNFTQKEAIVIGMRVVKEVIQVANLVESGVKRNLIPLRSWYGTEWALTDADEQVRRAYVQALLTYFRLEISQDDAKLKKHRNVSAHTGFLARLHLALYDYALRRENTIEDYLVINIFLLTVVKQLGLYGIIHGVPMILKLQDTIHHNNGFENHLTIRSDRARPLLPAARHLLTLDTIILLYFEAASDVIRIPELHAQVTGEIASRRKIGEWVHEIENPPRDPLDTTNSNTNDPEKIDDHDGGNDAIDVTEHSSSIDRQAIVDFIESCTKLDDNVKQELVGPWDREQILNECMYIYIHLDHVLTKLLLDPDNGQASIADTDAPIIFRVTSRTHKPTRSKPVRSAW